MLYQKQMNKTVKAQKSRNWFHFTPTSQELVKYGQELAIIYL